MLMICGHPQGGLCDESLDFIVDVING